jgi:hypothetical protein
MDLDLVGDGNRVLVLGARHMDFKSQQTGEQVRGTKVFYCYADSEPVEDAKGVTIIEEWVRDQDLLPTLSAVPGVYDLEFGRRAGRRGRPIEFLKGLRFVAPFPLFGAAPAK